MTNTVTLVHPNLGDSQTIEVPKLAVPHYRAAGWVTPDELSEPEPATTKSAPRRSRSTKE